MNIKLSKRKLSSPVIPHIIFPYFVSLSLQGIAQISIADFESCGELQLQWYPIQIFTGSEHDQKKEKNKYEEGGSQILENKSTAKMVWT